MIEPSENDIGKRVVYNKAKTSIKSKTTVGSIAKIDRQYVYVLYDGDQKPVAAKRKNLDWEGGDGPHAERH